MGCTCDGWTEMPPSSITGVCQNNNQPLDSERQGRCFSVAQTKVVLAAREKRKMRQSKKPLIYLSLSRAVSRWVGTISGKRPPLGNVLCRPRGRNSLRNWPYDEEFEQKLMHRLPIHLDLIFSFVQGNARNHIKDAVNYPYGSGALFSSLPLLARAIRRIATL